MSYSTGGLKKCPACNGAGCKGSIGKTCSTCKGKGLVKA